MTISVNNIDLVNESVHRCTRRWLEHVTLSRESRVHRYVEDDSKKLQKQKKSRTSNEKKNQSSKDETLPQHGRMSTS